MHELLILCDYIKSNNPSPVSTRSCAYVDTTCALAAYARRLPSITTHALTVHVGAAPPVHADLLVLH